MTLDEIVEQFVLKVRIGEEVSIESYVAQYPEYESELKEVLPITLVLEDAQQEEMTKTVAMTPPSPTIPDVVGPYRVIREIGHGGMSGVYEVVDTTSNQTVALKVHNLPYAAREAKILAALSHENIVKVYDSGQINGVYYTIMEFVDGCSLNHFNFDSQLLYEGKTSDQCVAMVILQTAKALAHAHSRGIIHRDVKPGNILLTKTGSVRLSDFDLAGGMNVTDVPPSGGTFKYMAPERLLDQTSPMANSPKIDQFALGKTLLELLDDNSDSTLKAIGKKCMSRNPAQRYATMDEVVEVLTDWLDKI